MPEQTEHQDTQTAQISGTVQITKDSDKQNRPDEEEIPEEPARRLELARKIVAVATGKYGIAIEDIVVAGKIYELAKERGVGKTVSMWDTSRAAEARGV